VPTGEREEGEKGEKRRKKGDEVAADRWGRAVSGMGAGCIGRRVGWAKRRWRAGWLAAARIRFKGFPILYKPNDSNLNSNSNLNPLKEIQINPK
jgi:hypothetical protein